MGETALGVQAVPGAGEGGLEVGGDRLLALERERGRLDGDGIDVEGDAGDDDGAEQAMPGLELADFGELEGGGRELERLPVLEDPPHAVGEELVGADGIEGGGVDLEGVEVDGDADDGVGLVGGPELAMLGGEEAARIGEAGGVLAVEGDAARGQVEEGTVGVGAGEDEGADAAVEAGVAGFGGFRAEGGGGGRLIGGADADPYGAGVGGAGAGGQGLLLATRCAAGAVVAGRGPRLFAGLMPDPFRLFSTVGGGRHARDLLHEVVELPRQVLCAETQGCRIRCPGRRRGRGGLIPRFGQQGVEPAEQRAALAGPGLENDLEELQGFEIDHPADGEDVLDLEVETPAEEAAQVGAASAFAERCSTSRRLKPESSMRRISASRMRATSPWTLGSSAASGGGPARSPAGGRIMAALVLAAGGAAQRRQVRGGARGALPGGGRRRTSSALRWRRRLAAVRRPGTRAPALRRAGGRR
jgi:hypothetical protein